MRACHPTGAPFDFSGAKAGGELGRGFVGIARYVARHGPGGPMAAHYVGTAPSVSSQAIVHHVYRHARLCMYVCNLPYIRGAGNSAGNRSRGALFPHFHPNTVKLPEVARPLCVT
jgi:hypothetical protein